MLHTPLCYSIFPHIFVYLNVTFYRKSSSILDRYIIVTYFLNMCILRIIKKWLAKYHRRLRYWSRHAEDGKDEMYREYTKDKVLSLYLLG